MRKRSSTRAKKLSVFHVMAKPAGPMCNLGCRYCFYLEKEKLYGKTVEWIMPEAVLESYISQFIASQDTPTVSFAWQGGEPTLLGIDYFRKVMALQNKYANGKEIDNSLQTNGILLDDQWGEFLAANRFLVGLSLDGPADLHDFHRVDKGGQPTFERVMRGLGFLKKHGVEFNALTVVNRRNSEHPLPVYRFLKVIGCQFIQFIPVVERATRGIGSDGLVLISPRATQAADVTDWSVEPQAYGDFLCSIFDEWVRDDVGKVYVQLFDVVLESWLGLKPSLCTFSPTCGEALVLEHNGDLYSCDHYVYPENKLGNILDQPLKALVNSAQQRRFGRDKRDSLPRYCRECPFRFACNGGCPKHRFLPAPDGEAGLNYLCSGYRRFFQHVDPYMKFMAAELRHERPPANVMQWVRSRENPASVTSKR